MRLGTTRHFRVLEWAYTSGFLLVPRVGGGKGKADACYWLEGLWAAVVVWRVTLNCGKKN